MSGVDLEVRRSNMEESVLYYKRSIVFTENSTGNFAVLLDFSISHKISAM